jgi:hypothetical protein
MQPNVGTASLIHRTNNATRLACIQVLTLVLSPQNTATALTGTAKICKLERPDENTPIIDRPQRLAKERATRANDANTRIYVGLTGRDKGRVIWRGQWRLHSRHPEW